MKKRSLLSISLCVLLGNSLLFAQNDNRKLGKVIADENTVVVDKGYIDNLSKGWNLIGVEHKIPDMSIFSNTNIIWIYKNSNWQAYSPNTTTNSLITSNGYTNPNSIDPASGIWVNIDKDLPKIDSFSINSNEFNSTSNTGLISFTSLISFLGPATPTFYNNGSEVELTDGNYLSGKITLPSGSNNIEICAEDSDNNIKVCKTENILVEGSLNINSYEKIELDYSSLGLTTYNNFVISADKLNGDVYFYNVNTGENIKKFTTGYKVSGLVYLNNFIYVSSTYNDKVSKYDMEGTFVEDIYSFNFPDGMGTYNNLLYVVQNDEDSELAIINPDTKVKVGTIETGVADIVGVVGKNDYLYILGEDGDIYKINPMTGESIKFFNNSQFTGEGNYGLEGITIVDNYIWVTYVNDGSLYKINIPIE